MKKNFSDSQILAILKQIENSVLNTVAWMLHL
jgi:hypothetical protein